MAQYVSMYEFAVTPAVTNIRRRGVEICDVAPDSLGAEMDLESGDRIIKVNGRVVRDYLDFRFQTAGETELVLEVRKKSGEDWEVELDRAEGEDFGLSFEQIVPRQCANECIFCFCNGNPADARPSLFIKDAKTREARSGSKIKFFISRGSCLKSNLGTGKAQSEVFSRFFLCEDLWHSMFRCTSLQLLRPLPTFAVVASRSATSRPTASARRWISRVETE